MSRPPSRRAALFAACALAAGALLAGAAWVGWEREAAAPDLVPLPGAPGFRRLAEPGGASAAGGAVLLGLGGGEAAPPLGPQALCAALWASPGVPAEGPEDGRPRIAIFSDANCPYCRELDGIVAALAADRPDLRIVHHEWPVLGPGSALAARATLAAGAQGAAEAMRRRLLAARFVITPDYIAAAAAPMGLDPQALLAEMEAPRIDAALTATARAAAALGLRGTPAVVVGGALAEGAVTRATLERLIGLEAARPDPPCP